MIPNVIHVHHSQLRIFMHIWWCLCGFFSNMLEPGNKYHWNCSKTQPCCLNEGDNGWHINAKFFCDSRSKSSTYEISSRMRKKWQRWFPLDSIKPISTYSILCFPAFFRVSVSSGHGQGLRGDTFALRPWTARTAFSWLVLQEGPTIPTMGRAGGRSWSVFWVVCRSVPFHSAETLVYYGKLVNLE